MTEYVSCKNCNGLLTKRFVQKYGDECADCHAPLNKKIARALWGRR